LPGLFNFLPSFFDDAAAGRLPSVAFVDPAFGIFPDGPAENDEHPGSDIRIGQNHVAQIVNAIRNSPNWKNSIIFITYDEHGGFYDHVGPPAAPQGGALNPDGISPGQCADASNPPASAEPGEGLNCILNAGEESSFCPGFTPTSAFPESCANFDQLGMRVPLIAVSPFSKPRYVSHTVGDHTSILALIEKRFFGDGSHLTARDANASTLEDMFDFTNAPSANTTVSPSLAPAPGTTLLPGPHDAAGLTSRMAPMVRENPCRVR
jgi:phospholipase C